MNRQEIKKRPVRCHFCKEDMYYYNDTEWEPEFRIDISPTPTMPSDSFYVHQECWKLAMKAIAWCHKEERKEVRRRLKSLK